MLFKRCPTADRLEQFALAARGADRIARHVAGCARCRKIIEEFRADAALVLKLRQAAESGLDETARRRLLDICRVAKDRIAN